MGEWDVVLIMSAILIAPHTTPRQAIFGFWSFIIAMIIREVI